VEGTALDLAAEGHETKEGAEGAAAPREARAATDAPTEGAPQLHDCSETRGHGWLGDHHKDIITGVTIFPT